MATETTAAAAASTTGTTTLTGDGGAAGGTASGATETTSTQAASDTTDASKAADAKATEAAKAVAIELKLPEGFAKDDPLLGRFTEVAKELGLDSAKAQKVFDLYAAAQAEAAKASQAAVEKEQRGWQEALKADKEFGGEKLSASADIARRAIKQYGDDALKELLHTTGLGDHPALVRFAYRAGLALKEDSVAGSNGAGSASASLSDEQFARTLYPTMFKEQ